MRRFKDKIYFAEDEIWSYRFNRKNYMIHIMTPECDKTYKIGVTDLPGWTIDTLERAILRKWIKIRPREVKNYIKENLK